MLQQYLQVDNAGAGLDVRARVRGGLTGSTEKTYQIPPGHLGFQE